MKLSPLSSLFIETVQTNKKIGKLGFTESETLNFLYTIDFINSLKYDEYTIKTNGTNYRLDQYHIDKMLVSLIAPSRVRLSFDRFAKDVLVRESSVSKSEVDQSKCSLLTPDQFESYQELLKQAFKSQYDYVDISTLRDEDGKTLTDFISKLDINGKVKDYNDKGMITFTAVTDIIDTRYFSAEVDESNKLAIKHLIRSLGSRGIVNP